MNLIRHEIHVKKLIDSKRKEKKICAINNFAHLFVFCIFIEI